jgi:hypothetical protein
VPAKLAQLRKQLRDKYEDGETAELVLQYMLRTFTAFDASPAMRDLREAAKATAAAAA